MGVADFTLWPGQVRPQECAIFRVLHPERFRETETLAKIRTDFTALMKDGKIELTRTQLTSRSAPNPRRHGAMTPGRLYGEIIPDLITRNFARKIPKPGKLHVYQFTAVERGG